jgi:hypothetical protein
LRSEVPQKNVRQSLWELQIGGTAAGDVGLDFFGLVHGATEYQVLVTFTKGALCAPSGHSFGTFSLLFQSVNVSTQAQPKRFA